MADFPQQHPKNTTHRLRSFLLGAIIIVASFTTGYDVATRNAADVVPYTFANGVTSPINGFDATLFAKVITLVKSKYVDKEHIDDKALFYGALKGAVAAIGDPYTVYLDPKSNDDLNQELSGAFEGIGAEIGIKDNRLVVIAPLAGSPAEKAGLHAGDTILSINGIDSSTFTIDNAVSQIRGKAGTTVTLSIYRDGPKPETHDFTVTREKIKFPSVDVKWHDKVAVMSLYNFNQNSDKEFFAALTTVSQAHPTGIVLDLRNNPGGLLDRAVSIASAWIPKGHVVVHEEYHDSSQNIDYTATSAVKAPDVPLVVLVNEGSASAAEILAGALQDYGIAKLVGKKTYGKGSVQDLESLPDGSGVKVTISKWLTPKKRAINNVGIEPDVTVEYTAADAAASKDPQLDAALKLIATP